MAVPRNRHSNQRRDTRRSSKKLQARQATACRQCGAAKMPHRACPSCGMYRGRPTIQPQEAA